MKIAFSTLACPQWTLAEAAEHASAMGYLGLEMRSFLSPMERMASDPMSMEPAEVDSIFDDAGIAPVCLATSVKFDKMVEPPLIGRIFVNEEAGVSDAKRFVDHADRAGVKFVRVYGCDLPAVEPRSWSMRRVTERLKLAAQTCRNTDVRLLLENAGSFPRASDLRTLIETVDSQWLGASYNITAAVQGGECPMEGFKAIADYARIVRIGDIDADGEPVPLGTGEFPLAKFVALLGEMGYKGWIVYEYPKLWKPELSDDARSVLTHAAETLYSWIKGEPAGV